MLTRDTPRNNFINDVAEAFNIAAADTAVSLIAILPGEGARPSRIQPGNLSATPVFTSVLP